MTLGVEPMVDFVFKALYGLVANCDLLIYLLNAVLRLKSPIVEVEILNPFNEKEFEDDKLSVLDIKARDADGRWFNVEMQCASPGSLRKRLPYYNALLYVAQLSDGEPYQNLQPAITICFLKETLFPEVNAPHLSFVLHDSEHGVQLTDGLQIHTVELAKYNFKTEQVDLEKAEPLEKLAFFLSRAAEYEAAELRRLLPEPIFQKAIGVLEMISQTPEQRMLYEARRKAVMDHRSFLLDSREEGIEIGVKQGIEKGREEGRKLELSNQIRWFQGMLRKPVSSESELLAMDFEHLLQLCEALKAECMPPNGRPE